MIAKLKRANIIFGGLSIIIGTFVLVGWWHEFNFMQQLFPQLYPMRSATAMCFIVCGLSIASAGLKISFLRLVLRIGLIGVFFVGIVQIVNYFFYPFDLSILSWPIKMSLASGLLFCILATVLFNNSLGHRYAYKVNLFLILFGLAISLLAITGYILDYQALYSLFPFSTMAPHTAVTFIILFLGAFISLEDNLLLDLISANSLGGQYARTVLPVGLLMPVLLGLLLLAAVRWHLFSLEVSFILLVFLCSLVVTTIVYQKSKLIHKIDLHKQKTLENMRLLNAQLGKLNEELRLHENELKAEKEVLTNTNETLDTFVHAASHDLRSPVQNMKALHQLMKQEEDEMMRNKYLKALESSTNRLENTINGLMGIVALQSNQESNVEELSFQQVLDTILADCTLQKGDEVIGHFNEAPYIVYVKPYLQSILRNLLTNAIKYRNPDKNLKLHISTKRVGHRVRLQVQDNGIGIDLQRYGHLIFQPFKRFSDQAPGSGIGLHLIKGMIEKNEGTIRVESTLGIGTTFYCELIEY